MTAEVLTLDEIGNSAQDSVYRFWRLWKFTPGATRTSVEAARAAAIQKLDGLPPCFVAGWPELVAEWRSMVAR